MFSLWSILWDKNSSASDLVKVIPGNKSRKAGKLDGVGMETHKAFIIKQVTTVVKLGLFPLGNTGRPCRCTSNYSTWGPRKPGCSIQQSLFCRWLMAASEISNQLFLPAWIGPTFLLWQAIHRSFQWAAWGVQKWVLRECGVTHLSTSYRYGGNSVHVSSLLHLCLRWPYFLEDPSFSYVQTPMLCKFNYRTNASSSRKSFLIHSGKNHFYYLVSALFT